MTPAIQQLLLTRRESRPNEPFAGGLAEYITIHQTGNRSRGADAHSHALWLAGSAPYSWHATIDDSEIWQSLRWDEQGWHAGDGLNGPGNTGSLGLEICVNEGIDAEAAAANAAWLVAHLREQGHGRGGTVQHHHWTGKNCPELIRGEPGRWERFLIQVDEHEQEEDMTQLADLNRFLRIREKLRHLASANKPEEEAKMIEANRLLTEAGIFEEEQP